MSKPTHPAKPDKPAHPDKPDNANHHPRVGSILWYVGPDRGPPLAAIVSEESVVADIFTLAVFEASGMSVQRPNVPFLRGDYPEEGQTLPPEYCRWPD